MSVYRAVFWDIDGVIVHSEELHAEKIRATAQKHSIHISDEDWASWHGIGDHRIFKILQERGLALTEQEFLEETLAYYVDHQEKITRRDGFFDAFNYIAAVGAFQAAVTSGVQKQAETNLDVAGVRSDMLFNVNATDMMLKGLELKPKPDPYNEALCKLNETVSETRKILASQCLVIEDSVSGVRSAKAAGMTSVHWPLAGHKPSEDADIAVPPEGILLESIRPFLS